MTDNLTPKFAPVSSSLATTTASSRSRTGRSGVVTSRFEPNPIILEISSTVLRVGYADQNKPQHVIRMEDPIFDTTTTDDNENDETPTKTKTKSSKTKTESDWYRILSPLIDSVYDRLMCKPSSRRVVCLYSNQKYAPLQFQRALQQHFWNRGVSACVELDPLEVLPVSLGWTRGLGVHLNREEAYCVCLADNYALPYTYQMVPEGGYKHWLNHETNKFHGGKQEDVFPSSSDNNDNYETNLQSLAVAILLCLQACPRDLRLHVVSNIVFCGDGVLLMPDLPRRVMKRVKEILENSHTNSDEKKDDKEDASSNRTTTVFGSVPLDVGDLTSLASKIGLISCSPYRADWICWVGASLWASVWNKYNDEETPIPWSFQPK